MKWNIRLARDMGQEAFVVIEAPTSEEAEAILSHDMNPDVIQWSDDDVMGDREVREVYPADDKEELTPLEMPSVPSVRQPKALKTYRVTWVIEVEADMPLSAARRARSWQTQPGTVTYEVYEVCLCPAERYRPPVTIDLTPTPTEPYPTRRAGRRDQDYAAFYPKPDLQSLPD
jgi:hypothetical protein